MRSLALGVGQHQQQALSLRLQHAVRLLQLSSLDFTQELHAVLDRNPFLESEESDSDSPAETAVSAKGAELPCAAEPGPPLPDVQEMEPLPGPASEVDGPANDDVDGERESWQADGQSSQRRTDDSALNPLDLQASEESLSDNLLRQLHVLPLAPRDLALAEAIVGSLDDDGYLRFPLAELTDIADVDPPPSEAEFRIALSRVQALDPPGVGARSVRECLLLQLPAIDGVDRRQLARRIIDDHLDALAARDVAGLARALACPPGEIQAVFADIRRLDPHPGWRFSSAQAPYVTPDVIVKKVRGQWTASLNPAIVPNVRLNQVYAELFQRHRGAQHAELAAHLQDARWTVSNVRQRFATILSVAQAIVSRQQHFLEYGALAMKPLVLREIAAQVGLHESTVSRVTNNKYMATPLGVFELKYFFSRAMTTASGGECSSTAIRGLIKDMIAAESPHAPLSDAEITRRLDRQGFVVARRTVTKYRQLLRIEAFERRRQHR